MCTGTDAENSDASSKQRHRARRWDDISLLNIRWSGNGFQLPRCSILKFIVSWMEIVEKGENGKFVTSHCTVCLPISVHNGASGNPGVETRGRGNRIFTHRWEIIVNCCQKWYSISPEFKQYRLYCLLISVNAKLCYLGCLSTMLMMYNGERTNERTWANKIALLSMRILWLVYIPVCAFPHWDRRTSRSTENDRIGLVNVNNLTLI